MERRKFVIGLGALASGAAAAVGTGAFTAAELSGRSVGVTVADDSQGLVALVAGENDYVSEGDDGELGIDLSNGSNGVNPNSKYQIGAIPEFDDETALKSDPLHVGPNTDSSDHAFQIQNQSASNQAIEVEVDMDECPDDATIYLVGYTDDNTADDGQEALVEGKVDADNDWQGLLSFTEETSGAIVGSGGAISVSILVDREGKTTSTESEEWSGTMTVRAGENDDIFSPNSGS